MEHPTRRKQSRPAICRPAYADTGLLLLGREELFARASLIKCLCDGLSHRTPALTAIELAAMMCLHGLGTTRTRSNRVTYALFIDPSANTNDHENHLQSLRMIVNYKCE